MEKILAREKVPQVSEDLIMVGTEDATTTKKLLDGSSEEDWQKAISNRLRSIDSKNMN